MSMIRRHFRLLLAICLGAVLAGLSLGLAVKPLSVALIGVNGFFTGYLGLTLRLTLRSTADDLRRRADEDDEGIVLILILALTAIAVSLAAIFQVLAGPEQDLLSAGLSLAAVPLGWAMVHTLVAFRYARLFYTGRVGFGLRFHGTADPGPWDFLYHAFAIGTSAAVSDVDVESTPMRRLVLLHATGSFFYNTVILALAVNAGLVLGGVGS